MCMHIHYIMHEVHTYTHMYVYIYLYSTKINKEIYTLMSSRAHTTKAGVTNVTVLVCLQTLLPYKLPPLLLPGIQARNSHSKTVGGQGKKGWANKL